MAGTPGGRGEAVGRRRRGGWRAGGGGGGGSGASSARAEGCPAETLPPTRERWSRGVYPGEAGRGTRGPDSGSLGFLRSWRRRRGPGTQSPESL